MQISIIGKVYNRLGARIPVTHGSHYINHSLVRSRLGSLTALGMDKTNFFQDKIDFENLLILEKAA